MTLRVSGKSISVGEALRDRVSERTNEVLRKYFDGNYSATSRSARTASAFAPIARFIWIRESRLKRIR